MATSFVTEESEDIRCSYLNVFKARLNDLSGNEEYSSQLLIPKSANKTLKDIKSACDEALANKFAGKVPASAKKSPLRDGDEPDADGNERAECYAGHWFCNVKNSNRPGVVDENVQPIIDSSEFTSGDYVRVSLNAYAYDNKGNKGVALGLSNIQRVRKGEPLGNVQRAESVFDVLETTDANFDPLA